MVYYPSNRKIQKHRLVEFASRMNKGMLDAEDDDLVAQSKRKSVNHHLSAIWKPTFWLPDGRKPRSGRRKRHSGV